MSIARDDRSAAAIVVRIGAERSEIVGGWKLLNSVSSIVERSGSGMSGGKIRITRRDAEPVTRYLRFNQSLSDTGGG